MSNLKSTKKNIGNVFLIALVGFALVIVLVKSGNLTAGNIDKANEAKDRVSQNVESIMDAGAEGEGIAKALVESLGLFSFTRDGDIIYIEGNGVSGTYDYSLENLVLIIFTADKDVAKNASKLIKQVTGDAPELDTTKSVTTVAAKRIDGKFVFSYSSK